MVGIGMVTFFARPNSTDYDDVAAANRFNLFDMGVLLHPLVFGDYPAAVRQIVDAKSTPSTPSLLPKFSEEDKKGLAGEYCDTPALCTFLYTTTQDFKHAKCPARFCTQLIARLRSTGSIDFVGVNAYFGKTVVDSKKSTGNQGGGPSLVDMGPRGDAGVTAVQNSMSNNNFGDLFSRVKETT